MLRFRHALRSVARSFAASLAASSLLASASASAQGDLLVAPTRVIIDNRGTAEVILSNIGDKEATYRISTELRRMTTDGDLVPVAADDANDVEKAALAMVRYAPRRVVLPPGQPQALRVSARPAADLPDGEYRVHMSFNGQPEVTPVSEQASEEDATGLAVHLIPVYSITIPIIVRKGHLEATATIGNPRVEQGPNGPVFKLDMARSGTASVFGEIRVTRAGDSDPVFLARGIAIYPEIDHRTLVMPITLEQAAAIKGPLHFEYREFFENGGALLASTDGTIG